MSGMWFGVAPRMGAKKASCVSKRLYYVFKI